VGAEARPTGEAAAAETTEARPKASLELGVLSRMASGRFWRTKLISFTHRFVLVNCANSALLVRQFGASKTTRPLLLPPHVRCAWHWPLRGGAAAAAGGGSPMISLCLPAQVGSST
jgi:hypothetical protein